jgi:hypothetical protein
VAVEKMRERPQNRSRLPAYVSRWRFSDLHHSASAFGLNVGGGNGRIAKEAQSILARCEPQEKQERKSRLCPILRRAASFPLVVLSSFRLGERAGPLRRVQSEPLGENGGVTSLEEFEEARPEKNAALPREIRRATGAKSRSNLPAG